MGLRAAGLHRKGRDFYALRHTFRTVADEVGDPPAVDLVMGHENGTDVATYVERIGDERLRKSGGTRTRVDRTQITGETSQATYRVRMITGPQRRNWRWLSDKPGFLLSVLLAGIPVAADAIVSFPPPRERRG